MELFVAGVIGLGIALVVNIVFNRLGVPVVIGYIFTGVVLSSFLHIVDVIDLEVLDHFAEFGIVFLMFMIGLEFSFSVLQNMRQEVLFFGGLQVAITTLVFFAIGYFVFSLDIRVAFVVGAALSLSSTAIVLKIFNETKEVNTAYGRNAVGILIMQDIAVIPILLMISILSSDDVNFELLIMHTTLNALVLLLVLFYPAKWVIVTLLRNAAKSRMDEIFMGATLFIVFASSLLAHLFGFSYSLGAFIAGMIIAGTRYKFQVEADLTHFRDLLLGLFFMTVGMQVNIHFLLTHIHIIVGLLVAVMFLKALIIYGITRFYRSGTASINTAFALCQVGEFSFAIFALSNAQMHLLDSYTHQILLLCVILSMILTPFLLKNLHKISSFLMILVHGRQKVSLMAEEGQYSVLEGHIVVCGYGRYGRELVAYLKNQNQAYIAVDADIKAVNAGYANGDNILFGNIVQKSIIEKIRVEEASVVVMTLEDIAQNQHISKEIMKEYPQTRIVLLVATQQQKKDLEGDSQFYRVVAVYDEVSRILGQVAIECVLETEATFKE
ncbi:hypothetical protein CCZ01_03665 [Helicobacter monodelphidis]|uniref:cation:proton antiporter n=1 Tax=Helicobacter sp. 15-1451 TaxID=2004995 RepID=UPI000DCF39FD|nr:cation:proton antiporter [Helicobacter sp. 15-1451]RAX58182.1 hypothetical protein CCZ01_03665 [Helicobacter sp. 15-1451]